MLKNQTRLVELKLRQDFQIDSVTVSCPNCARGVTLHATKDGSLKALSSEHLQCPKTVEAPLGATTAGKNDTTACSVEALSCFQVSTYIAACMWIFCHGFQPSQFLLRLLKQMSSEFTRRWVRCHLLPCQFFQCIAVDGKTR